MKVSALFAIAAAAAACGGGNASSPDAARSDSGPIPTDAAPLPTAVIAAGDFTAGDPGVLASFSIGSRTTTRGLAPQGAIGDNPIVRHIGSELFVVNSADGDNVTVLDDSQFTLVEQLATGSGTDPQDVAEVGTKLYVPIYGGSGVEVLTRGSASASPTIVDLSADDPDGLPNCASAYAVGSDVYVTCQLLDDSMDFAPRGSGEVYVIDSTTDTVRTQFALTTENPFSLIESMGNGNLAVASVDFGSGGGSGSGCVEQITTGATPESGGCILDNARLGGYVARMQFQPLQDNETLIWMAVEGLDFANPTGQLMGYDITSSELWPALSGSNELVVDVGLCPDGSLIVSDTQGSGGVRLYQLATEVTTQEIPVGLPPGATHGIACY